MTFKTYKTFSSPLLLATILMIGCSDSVLVQNMDEPDLGAMSDMPEDSQSDQDSVVEVPQECPQVVQSGALSMDGSTQIAMGNRSEFGLETFTLEAWVRRNGRGGFASTGVGGLRIEPLISKGRGESDGSNVDCNYAFGFVGDVLGADFEDMESGANHPVLGKTPIPDGTWNHVVATYDGTTWKLYLNAKLDAEVQVDATPRFDSIQHFGLGAMWNSEGVSAGGFIGDMAQARVYSRALSADEIAANMMSSNPISQDLVGHWALGEPDGELQDGIYIEDGPILDQGTLPRFRQLDMTRDGLTIAVDDDDQDHVELDVFVRKITDQDDFTVVVIPDSQYYTRDANPPSRPNPDNPEFFRAQTRWAMEHIESDNVVGLIHVGDIVNNANQPSQWSRAVSAIEILETPSQRFPEGLPYGLSYGNHDQYPAGSPNDTAEANTHLGLERFADFTWFGGSYSASNADETWVSFWVGELQIIALNMQFAEEPNPRVLEWARNVFLSHPNALGIVNSHYIVRGNGEFSPQGAAIYEALKDVDNVQLMASGHVSHAARRTDDYQGNLIHSMLQDYQRMAIDPTDPSRPIMIDQSTTNGGQGFMRVWRFSPKNQTLSVRTISPYLNHEYTNDDNQFVLDVDIKRAGSDFTQISGLVTKTSETQVIALDLEEGEVAEWYAVTRDCQHEVRTDIFRIQ